MDKTRKKESTSELFGNNILQYEKHPLSQNNGCLHIG